MRCNGQTILVYLLHSKPFSAVLHLSLPSAADASAFTGKCRRITDDSPRINSNSHTWNTSEKSFPCRTPSNVRLTPCTLQNVFDEVFEGENMLFNVYGDHAAFQWLGWIKVPGSYHHK